MLTLPHAPLPHGIMTSCVALALPVHRSAAWVSYPVVGANDAHDVVECSAKGLCDRKTGECQCFDNYDGERPAPPHSVPHASPATTT
jgi:hypothetical protein